ncbi:hypothetical protein NUM3379_23780 [Kineococcus sp. NUM-3379]
MSGGGTARPAAGAQDRPTGAGASAAELRRELHAERAARREAELGRELAEAALEALDVGVLVTGPDGRVRAANRTARQWSATAAATAAPAGAGARRPVHRALREPLHRVLHEGPVSGEEVVLSTAEGPATVAVCSGRALSRADGTPLGAVLALTDVTVDRAREAALRAAHDQLSERGHQLAGAVKELQRSNTDLERFAALASHDLTSPLQSVAGYLDLLADAGDDRLDEQAREWLDAALRGVRRMQDLTSALLSYAHVGAAPTRRELVEFREVLDDAVLDLHGRIRAAGARVVSDGLPRVYCDPVLLQQLLRHLLSSALRYRSPQRSCRIRVSAELSEDRWVFTVADNGDGIPPADRDRVFDVFASLEAGGTARPGIGLATCRRIVERHGGRIWAAGEPGGGTSVHFTLPQRHAG